MKYFWPVYLCSLALGTSAVYWAAPLARPFFERPEPEALAVDQAVEPRPLAPEAPASEGVKATVAPVADAVVAAPASGAGGRSGPPVGLPPDDGDEAAPAMLGIYPARRGDRPEWGITIQETDYYKPDGTRLGNMAAGVVFDWREAHQSSKGAMVEGLFSQNASTQGPFLVSRKDVHLYVGTRTRLSARQIEALRAYYRLNGNIAARKNELLRDSAARNPHFPAYQAAYRAYIAHIEKAQEVVQRRDGATEFERSRLDEQVRQMKVTEARLRVEHDAQHQKFRAWREQHASEIGKPENDPDIRRWTEEMAALRRAVPGLAM